MTNKNFEINRMVATDQSSENNYPAAIGEWATVYTVTRAFRGPLVVQNAEFIVLAEPTIVWIADGENVNKGKSEYFVVGKVPTGRSEEKSGARFVVISKSGINYVIRHRVTSENNYRDDFLKILDSDLIPKKENIVHVCTSTHEFRGKVKDSVSEMFVLDENDSAIVNEISTGNFSSVLNGELGSDHVKINGVSIYWHSIIAVIVK